MERALRQMSTAERAQVIAELICGRLGAALGPSAPGIGPETPFAQLKPEWSAIQDPPSLAQFGSLIDLHGTLDAALGGALGHPLYSYDLLRRPDPARGELRYRATPSQLARHLAEGMEPAPPAGPFTDPYAGGRFTWRLPPPLPPGCERAPAVTFVLSSCRAGSTLLRAMLDAHPALCAPDELSLLPFQSLADREAQLTEHGATFQLLGLGLWLEALRQQGLPVPRQDQAALQAPMAEVYRGLIQLLGGRMLVDKTPFYAMHPQWLARAEAMFARPRYVVLTRHPQAAIESFVRMRFKGVVVGNSYGVWDDHPWLFAEKCWAVSYRHILDFVATVDSDRVCFVRYEELVTDPAAALAPVCATLGVPYRADMADPYRRPIGGFLGDPNMYRRKGVASELAWSWRQGEPAHALSPYTRRVAEALGYEV